MPVDLRVYPCPEAERIMIAMIIIEDKGNRLIRLGLLLDERAFVKLRENNDFRTENPGSRRLRGTGDV